jgi:hypothetical protein
MIKMLRSNNAGERSIKSIACRCGGVKRGSILLLRKSILLFFARAGLLKVYLFFLLIMGFKELK